MDIQEKYGDTGSAAYKRWESKYKQIQKEIKFGSKSPENAFSELKKEINSDVDRYIAERENKKKFAWTTTLLAPVIFVLGTGLNAMIGGVAILAPLVAIILPIYGFSSYKGYSKALVAAIDFDEQYFGGEIFYKKKNGMAL